MPKIQPKFGFIFRPGTETIKIIGNLPISIITEISSRNCLEYGPVFEMWFDGANGGASITAAQARKIDSKTYYDWATTLALYATSATGPFLPIPVPISDG